MAASSDDTRGSVEGLDSWYILEVEPKGSTDELDVKCERKREIKDGFHLTRRIDTPFTEMRKVVGKQIGKA